jgi:non-heme chloroperoxidase
MYRNATLTLPDGPSLPYVESGDPRGLPVVLLHGYTDSWRSFEPVLPHLPPGLRVLVPTQRGHGRAGKPAGGYGLRDFATDLAAFLDDLDLDSAVIAGHSLGSCIAQRFALDHPRRVAGLVLAASCATAKGNPGLEELWEEVRTLEDPIPWAFAYEFQRSTLAQPVAPALLDLVTAESLETPARVWRAALRGLMGADHSAHLGQIEQPTLVVWGGRDELFSRAEQDALVAAIPRARLEIYPDAGHGLHWEEPRRFARDLAAFVEAVGRSAAGKCLGVEELAG